MRRLPPHLAPLGYSPRRYLPLSPAPVLGMGERLTDLREMQLLFANGENGGYWPADPEYSFEDSAGALAASVNGVVGLRFDVSNGLALGAITTRNYDFANGANQWVVSGNDATHTITFTTGSVRYQSGTTSPVLYLDQPAAMTPNAWNKLTITVSASNGGEMIFNNNGFITSIDVNPGSRSVIFKTGTTESYLNFYRAYSNQDVTLTSLIIQPILGNHAIQTTTANKPYLRVTPTTGKYWYDSNTATGALTATFSGALGSACTIATVTPEGVSILESQTVGATYNICPAYGYNADVLIIDRALTVAEKALVTRVMQRSVPSLGSNLAVNGSFATDTDWTKGTGWSIDGTAAKSAGTASNLTQTLGVSGNQYRVTADITRTAGTVGAYNGTAQIGATAATETAAKYAMKTTSTTVGFRGDASFAGTVDNAVIQEIL